MTHDLGISTYLCESPRLETDALPQVLTLRHLLKLVTERATAAMAFFALEDDAQHSHDGSHRIPWMFGGPVDHHF